MFTMIWDCFWKTLDYCLIKSNGHVGAICYYCHYHYQLKNLVRAKHIVFVVLKTGPLSLNYKCKGISYCWPVPLVHIFMNLPFLKSYPFSSFWNSFLAVVYGLMELFRANSFTENWFGTAHTPEQQSTVMVWNWFCYLSKYFFEYE